jgi:hypothetical protein
MIGHNVGHTGPDESEFDDERIKVRSRLKQYISENLAVKFAANCFLKFQNVDWKNCKVMMPLAVVGMSFFLK